MRHDLISSAGARIRRNWARLREKLAHRCESPFRLDLRSLAAMRMALGVTLLIDLSIRAPDLLTHYGVHGVLKCTPFSELKAPFHWDLFVCRDHPLFVQMHFALHALAAMCLTLGLFTRVATLLCWVLLTSLHHRQPLVLNAGDDLLRLLMLWSLFLPLGARWSLDALRADGPPKEQSTLSPATLALCLQVLVVYPLAVLGRRHSLSWWDGSALVRIVEHDLWTTHFGIALRAYPWFLRAADFGTLLWESLGPVLALLPVFGRGTLRTCVVCAFVALHAGIGLVLTVGTFPLVSIAGWLAFLPDGFWELFVRRRSSALSPTDLTFARRARGTWLVHVLASVLLVYTVAWNVQRRGVHMLDRLFFSHLAQLGGVLHLEEDWAVFSSPPSGKADGWFMLVASLQNGERVDLLRQGATASFAKPAYLLESIPSRHWGKILMRLKKHKRNRSRFLSVYAREWNALASCEQQIVSSELLFMPERSRSEHDKRVLWHLTQRWRRPDCLDPPARLSSSFGGTSKVGSP
jgi:hypothetical protein